MWSGVEAVSSAGSRVFQIVFWLFVPVILTNVLISFILEIYMKKWEYYKENYSDDYYLSKQFEDSRQVEVQDRYKPWTSDVFMSLNQVELEKTVRERENLTGIAVDNVENDKNIATFTEGDIYNVE